MNRNTKIPFEFVLPHCSNASLSFLVDIANTCLAVLSEIFYVLAVWVLFFFFKYEYVYIYLGLF